MKNYPYPSLIENIPLKITPTNYINITGNNNHTRTYKHLLPMYKYATCPISQLDCIQNIDIFGLSKMKESVDYRVYVGNFPLPNIQENRPSPYLAGIHIFLNLHNNIPSTNLTIHSEIPFVTPCLLSDVTEAYAVLHALPIYEIENDEFYPLYTAFLVTYFSSDIPTARRHCQVLAMPRDENGNFVDDGEYYGSIIPSVPMYTEPNDVFTEYYDLSYWADKGKLGWLDYTKKDLPLVIGKGKKLPEIYANIPGRKTRFEVRNGRIYPGQSAKVASKIINAIFNVFWRD